VAYELQIGQNSRHTLLGTLAVGVNDDFRSDWLLVRVGDSGEVLDLAA
jgi:hypothetical protein